MIQAPDGRRMSKSLGTGIDPLDEIDAHGADALRFGLLAMSSSQDVRYSAAGPAGPRPREQDVERVAADPAQRRRRARADARAARGPLDPVAAAARDRSVDGHLDAYDFAHAALELYRFFWSELCDWYLEIVKPRLYDGEPEVAANLLYVLERVSRSPTR